VTERRKDWLAVAALVLLAALLFPDVHLGLSDFYLRDYSLFHHPSKQILRNVVFGGEFPYWNRYFAAGQPLAANPQHEVFYPLNWLIFLPDYPLGFRLHVLVHLWLALGGMFALLRSMQRSRTAAMFGAISFGLGGVVLSYLNLLPVFFSAVWLPFVCLFARRYLRDRSPRDFALASLAMAMQLLIGEPTTPVQTGLILGLYALSRTPRLANVARVAAISATAFIAAAAQTLPTLDFVRDTIRARGLGFDVTSSFSLAPLRLAELLFPNVFGHLVTSEGPLWWGQAYYDGRGNPFLYGIYCGLGAIVLAVAGVCARTRGWRLFASIGAVSLLLAFGKHTPLLAILHNAGVADPIRFPEKFVLMFVFAMIVFAASVLDRLLAEDERMRTIALRVAAAIAVLSTAIALFSLTNAYPAAFTALWKLPRQFDDIVALSRRDWWVAAARAGLLWVLLWRMTTVKRVSWIAVAALFLVLDLATLAPKIAPRLDASFYREQPAALAQLPPPGPYRLFHAANLYYKDDPDAAPYVRARESYWMLRNGLFSQIPAAHRYETFLDHDNDGTALLPTADFTVAMYEVARHRPDWSVAAMAMGNARFRADVRPFAEAYAEAGGDLRRVQPVRFTDVGPGPRYWFASRLVRIRDARELSEHLVRERFDPSTAFIHEPPFVPARGVVRGWRETANTARIDVECTGRAFLIMSVTPHRWWRITIDGREARAVVTNVGFQGVEVPAGRHVVEMHYRNRLIDISAAISAIAIAALLVLSRRR
jgi:hypothetical protein